MYDQASTTIEMAKTIDRITAERDGYKRALGKIANGTYTQADYNLAYPEPTMIWEAVARAALATSSDTDASGKPATQADPSEDR